MMFSIYRNPDLNLVKVQPPEPPLVLLVILVFPNSLILPDSLPDSLLSLLSP